MVDFEKEAVAGLLVDGRLDALGVGHRQVVAHDLDVGLAGQLGPRIPIVLVERVLNGHN